MRHSLATFLSANDVHLSVTQSILRHKNMRTTADVNTHAFNAKQKEAQQKYQPLTQLGNRHLVQQVPPQYADLLFCCVVFAIFLYRFPLS
jgi:hypothetical protein